jgi:hypothetical protein
MNFIERLWRWLTSANSRTSRKGHPELYPLDVAKLKDELALVSEAKRLGEAGVPATDTVALTGTEASVVQIIEKARQDYMGWAVLRLQILSQDLTKCNVVQAVNRARQADKEFEREAGALLTEQDSLLQMLSDTARKRTNELNAFKVANGLTRDAHPPTSTGTFFLYAVLLFLIVLEGIFNAGFFAQGVDSGLLGGFAYAGVLAALNVGIAFTFGKFLVGNINHRDWIRKSLGATSLVIAACVMVMVGLVIAHLRDSLTAGLAEPPKAALESFLQSPFQLHDIFSWALFSISVVFGSFSLVDGLFSDDRYPGYGDIWKHTESAVADYEDEIAALHSRLQELKDRRLEDLDEVVRSAQASMGVFASLIEDKRAAGSRLSHALRDADYSLEALLQIFRTENQLHRGARPRPAYFDRKPELVPLTLPDFDTTSDEAVLSQQHDLVKALMTEVQGLRLSIQESFNRRFDSLQTLENNFQAKEVG